MRSCCTGPVSSQLRLLMCCRCWHHIQEDAAKQHIAARCPNCRQAYQKDQIKMEKVDPAR